MLVIQDKTSVRISKFKVLEGLAVVQGLYQGMVLSVALHFLKKSKNQLRIQTQCFKFFDNLRLKMLLYIFLFAVFILRILGS